mgnify:CR=1 FL=1
MAEYNSDEERLTAIMDFLKRNQRIILLTFGVVFFTAITSVSVNSYYANQNAQAAELYDAWFIDTLEETNTPIENEPEQLFDQDTNEEEDFEIPAFLRKQKF